MWREPKGTTLAKGTLGRRLHKCQRQANLKGIHSFMQSFIHSLTQQTFIEHLQSPGTTLSAGLTEMNRTNELLAVVELTC